MIRQLAHLAIIAPFVMWTSIVAFNAWKLSFGANYPVISQVAQQHQKLTDGQQRQDIQSDQELTIQRDIARFNQQLVTATWALGAIGFITASMGFGTAIVLYFTLHATETAVDAAKKSAAAVVAVERPRVRLSKLRFSRGGGDVRDRNRVAISIGRILMARGRDARRPQAYLRVLLGLLQVGVRGQVERQLGHEGRAAPVRNEAVRVGGRNCPRSAKGGRVVTRENVAVHLR
jgi:hypothetical protein